MFLYYKIHYYIKCCCCHSNNNDKLLGISIDTIFTALITITIFIVGLRFKKKSEDRKAFEELMDAKTYFYHLVRLLINSTQEQIKSFDDFLNELNEKREKDFYIKSVSSFTTKFISDIPSEKLFKAFVFYKLASQKALTIKSFKDIIVNIELIGSIERDWKITFQDFLTSMLKHDDEYNSYALKVGAFTDKMIHSVESRNLSHLDEFFKAFDIIVGTWQKIDNYRDKYIMMDNLITPLHKLCQKMPKDRNSFELLDYIMGCRYAFANLEKAKSVYIHIFEDYSKKLSNSINILESTLLDIQQKKDIKPSLF